MKVICEHIKNGICGCEFQPTRTCKHQIPHEKLASCKSGYCTTANRRTLECIPFHNFEIELPEDLFEL